MANDPSQERFNDEFCARIQALRIETGRTAEGMAIALGIPPDRYRKYEVRTPLPHFLIERFAAIVGRDIHFLITGKQLPGARTVSQEMISRKRA